MNPTNAQPRTDSEPQPRAARIVQRWAHIYTSGLPGTVRDDRTAELRSDLWEQLHDPQQSTSRKVIGRLAKGIPADLLWRLETRYHLGGLMTGTALLATRIGSALAALVAAFWLFWAVAWGQLSFAIFATVSGALAGFLWWVGTTAEVRVRRRRLIAGSAVATVSIAVVGAFLAGGTG